MSTIRLYKYNNYANRMCKVESSISGYNTNGTLKDDFDNINFNPADDVNTTLVLNSAVDADYLIVTPDNSTTITSRWFIIDRTRTRQGQYNYTLHRDVVAEYQSAILNSTAYVRRGIVPSSNPFIFNPEGNSYNQIKTSEGLIKDGTGVPWIVGYCDENLFGDPPADIYAPITKYMTYTETAESVDELLSRYPGSSTSGNPLINDAYVSVCNWTWGAKLGGQVYGTYTIDNPGGAETLIFNQQSDPNGSTIVVTSNSFQNFIANNLPNSSTRAALVTEELGRGNKAAYDYIYANRNKVVKVGTSPNAKYYKLIYSTQSAEYGEYTIGLTNPQDVAFSGFNNWYEIFMTGEQRARAINQESLANPAYNAFCTTLQKAIDAGYAYLDPANTYPVLRVTYTMQRYKAVWTELTADLTKIDKGAQKSNSSPYYIFCIPFRAVNYTAPGGISGTTDNQGAAYAARLIKELGSHVYDVQVVPYFPNQSLVTSGGVALSSVGAANVSMIDGPSSHLNFIYWSSVSEFSFNVSQSGLTRWNSGYNHPVKIQNETQFLRLNSPNYASSFDMSIAKNNGISTWKIRGKYKPFQPYIHVRPQWGGVYGQEVEDARGLICAGDFSMDLINNAWVDYQVQNKNYNLIFNRDIQTLDLQQGIARQEQAINAITNGISATVGGAVAGGMAGGAAGAVVGGIAAAAGSAVGAAIDWKNQELLREDARGAAIDKWGYQLGNIKARPTALTKVSSINPDNKYFPFYEIFEATTEEKQNLERQLTYNSMRLDVVTESLGSYRAGGGVWTFIRAEIIRINLPDANDAHIVAEIKRELEGGWYFYED